jgi:octaprenyl-diphosphate synthase
VDGEVIQLKGRTELDVSEETYERVLRDKTASLFSFATRSGALMAGASPEHAEALAEFGEHLGIAFQLIDDAIDYDGDSTGKTLHADLIEGKMTLPLVLAIADDPSLQDLVAQIHAGDGAPVAEVSRRVVASGALKEVRARAKERTQRAIAALGRVPASPSRMLLEVVASEMTRRSG